MRDIGDIRLTQAGCYLVAMNGDADILKCVRALDKLKPRGGDRGNQHTGPKVAKASSEAIANKSADETAAVIGIDRNKVEKARTIEAQATAEVKAAVEEGAMTINRAYARTPEGLDASPDQVRLFLKDQRLLDLWDRMTVKRQGGSNNPHGRAGKPAERINRDVITVDSPGEDRAEETSISEETTVQSRLEPARGTSRQYAIRRLRAQAPEIHAEVMAGTLTPHGGLVKAGFVPKTLTLPKDPRQAGRREGCRHCRHPRPTILGRSLKWSRSLEQGVWATVGITPMVAQDGKVREVTTIDRKTFKI